MRARKPLSIDVTMNSEETLLACAKMWRRVANVDWDAIQSELKMAHDKQELVELLIKYYGDVVEFVSSDWGDLNPK